MSERRPLVLDEIRERMREAAAREMPQRRRRSWRRRVAGGLVVAVVASGGAAVATKLISKGSPHKGPVRWTCWPQLEPRSHSRGLS